MQIKQLTPLYSVRWIEATYEDDIGELTKDFSVEIDGTVYTAPAGMRYGPSIPRRARSFVSVGDCLEGSAFHDLAYRCGFGSRKWADQVFRELVRRQSGPWIAWKAYHALRVFGERVIDDGLIDLVTKRGLEPHSGPAS